MLHPSNLDILDKMLLMPTSLYNPIKFDEIQIHESLPKNIYLENCNLMLLLHIYIFHTRNNFFIACLLFHQKTSMRIFYLFV